MEMENKYRMKQIWFWLYASSLIIFMFTSIISVFRNFDLIGCYMVLSSMILVIFCDSNMNREVLIETMMRLSAMQLVSTPEYQTFEKYMKKKKGGKLEDKQDPDNTSW